MALPEGMAWHPALGNYPRGVSAVSPAAAGMAYFPRNQRGGALTVPDPPTAVAASAGDTTAQVTFTAPENTGGSAITGYTATSTPGGKTATGVAAPLTVTGLTNAISYSFTVHATNAQGNSAESAASNSVTPNAVPEAPTIDSVTPGDEQLTIAFTPGGTGGSPILSYTVHYFENSVGWFHTAGFGTSSPIVLTGLTNSVKHWVYLAAVNANGEGTWSNAVVIMPNDASHRVNITDGTTAARGWYGLDIHSLRNGITGSVWEEEATITSAIGFYLIDFDADGYWERREKAFPWCIADTCATYGVTPPATGWHGV